MILNILFLFIILCYIINNVDSSGASLCNLDERTFNKNEEVPICIALMQNETRYKSQFWVKVDEFALLELDNSFNTDYYNKNTTVQIEASLNASKAINTATEELRVPFFTIIIELNQGEISSITWDDKCVGCLSDECIDGFCGIPQNYCGTADSQTDCDLKIYLGWFGTDKNGNYLTSAGQRLSAFRSWSLNEAFEAASETYKENQPNPDELLDIF